MPSNKIPTHQTSMIPKRAGVLRIGRSVAGIGRRAQAPKPWIHDISGTPKMQVLVPAKVSLKE